MGKIINNTQPIYIYLHSGLLGSAAHKSRTLSQPIEIAFNPDKVQIFPEKDIQTITPEAVSQQAETVHNVPQTGSPRPKSFVALKPIVAILLSLRSISALYYNIARPWLHFPKNKRKLQLPSYLGSKSYPELHPHSE